MVHLGHELQLGRRERVIVGYANIDLKQPALVGATHRARQDSFPREDIRLVRYELNVAHVLFGKIGNLSTGQNPSFPFIDARAAGTVPLSLSSSRPSGDISSCSASDGESGSSLSAAARPGLCPSSLARVSRWRELERREK